MSSSATTGRSEASPRTGSARARRRIVATSSSPSGWSTSTRQRDRSAALTSNEGFSVVAPIKAIVPSSTAGSSASCWALLNRWISSMNRTVRPPLRRAVRASTRASRTSFTPEPTAEIAVNRDRDSRASRRASVVLPVPGPPQRINEGRGPPSTVSLRTSRPSPMRCPWPTNSPMSLGRIRSANGESGHTSSSGSRSPSSKRLLVSTLDIGFTSRSRLVQSGCTFTL